MASAVVGPLGDFETYLLTPAQSAEQIGVPVVQLLRWAVLGQGPRNSGTKHKPLYTEDDLVAWKMRAGPVTASDTPGQLYG